MIPKGDLTRNIQKQPVPPSSGSRWRLWAGLAVLLLLLGGGVLGWAVFREDPNLAHAKELREQMKNFKDMSPEQRGEMFKDMRETMGSLTPAQRNQLDAPRQERQREDLKKFFAKSKEEQMADLDKRIDDMLARRQQWQQRQAGQDGQGGQGGPGAGGRGPGGGGGGGFGPPPGGRGGDSNSRQKNFIDSTSADFRGMQQAYRELMRDRMSQRGVSGPGGFGGFPGGGFGGGGGGGGGPRGP
jgi:hypothetical protein